MREKQEAEEKERLHHEKVRRLKLQGFTDWAMQHWTFENDNRQNPQMQLAQRYVNHWPEMREKNVGLLLWGGVGTGKSYMAGCIANALMEQEIAVCMTNFARIMNELNNAFAGRNEVVDRLCSYPLLVIDDFGMERGTEYALEQIYNIIDSRYRSRKPLIVTTNLTLTELKKPQDTAHARIYDRLLELCTPIACTAYYQSLLLSGKLDTVLADVEEQAAERYEVLIEQLSQQEGISEKLKEENQMEWVGRMKNLENRAAELVKAELIYTFERR